MHRSNGLPSHFGSNDDGSLHINMIRVRLEVVQPSSTQLAHTGIDGEISGL